MFVIDVTHCRVIIQSVLLTSMSEVQKFAMDWTQNKKVRFGGGVPRFNDFSISVYDVSKPCSSHHVEKPIIMYY